jgi:hypothetical protein
MGTHLRCGTRSCRRGRWVGVGRYSREQDRGHDTYNISQYDLWDTYLAQYCPLTTGHLTGHRESTVVRKQRRRKQSDWLGGRFGMQRRTGDVHKQQRSAAPSGGG